MVIYSCCGSQWPGLFPWRVLGVGSGGQGESAQGGLAGRGMAGRAYRIEDITDPVIIPSVGDFPVERTAFILMGFVACARPRSAYFVASLPVPS